MFSPEKTLFTEKNNEEKLQLLDKPNPGNYGSLEKISNQDGATLAWKNLSVFVSDKTSVTKNLEGRSIQIINNVSGIVKPGTLCAVIGASGAGKTTLLGTLSHRLSKGMSVQGDVFVNGRKVDEKIAAFFGYVDQFDLFMNSMTVKEHLLFMARLKMDKSETLASLSGKVQDVLTSLGLSEVQNNRIGSPGSSKRISGGEKKRLSCATEVLTNPSLLFCDEPTTGLDSFNAKKLMSVLKGMVSKGTTILCTIHQPSSELFSFFDSLIMMAEGRIAFLGTAKEAPIFLEGLGHSCPPSYNPADYYIHTLSVIPGREESSRDRINRICNAFDVSDLLKDIFADVQMQSNLELANTDEGISNQHHEYKTIDKPGIIVQFRWLIWRCFLESYRNPMLIKVKILQRLFIAAVISVIFFGTLNLDQDGIQNVEGLVFFLLQESFFPYIFGSLYKFESEIHLFLRDYKNGVYGITPYYFATVLSTIPGNIITGFIVTTFIYWAAGLRPEFYSYIITLFASVFVGNFASGFGLMFSALFKYLDTIMMILVPLNNIFYVLSGFMVKMNSLPSWLLWTRYIACFFLGNEIISVVQWEGIKEIACDEDEDVRCLATGEDVLQEFKFDPVKIGLDFFCLAIVYLGCISIGFFGLARRAKNE